MGTVGDFQTGGAASLSTGGNLLWNEASITQYGTMSFDTMPPSYLEALEKTGRWPGGQRRNRCCRGRISPA